MILLLAVDRVELTDQPLDAAGAIALVADDRAGGIAVFLGTTRAETNGKGIALMALDYEAYVEMALKQMRDLATTARRRWPILRLALLHRTGRVAVGESSVVIAISTAHRGQAFEACRWLIDTLKSSVAIWKQEVWADGSTSWVAGTAITADRTDDAVG